MLFARWLSSTYTVPLGNIRDKVIRKTDAIPDFTKIVLI